MTQTAVALAVPGDIKTLTGGYIYDRHLYEELMRAGYDTTLVALPDGFPFAPPQDMARACEQLQTLPAKSVVIVDGLAFGALPTHEVARIRARIIALVHHPLAFESELPPDEQHKLMTTERENLQHAAQVLVPSPHTKDVLVTHYGVKESLIHVALPGTAQLSSDTKSVLRPARPLILSVGILHPRKGHDVLIDALSRIRELDWDARIVGSPWEAGYLEGLQERIDRLSLSARVRLAGRMPRPALQDLYAQASLFALATRYEGYGMVFNEALVHGLPIVSCKTGAVPDTVPQAAGVLVPVDDPNAFGDAMSRVLGDPVLAANMRAAALGAAKSLCSWADTARIAGHAIDMATRATE